MRAAAIDKGVPALIGAIGAVLIWQWVSLYLRTPLLPDRPLGHEHHLPAPGAESSPSSSASSAASFYHPAVAVPALPGDWPGFRGANRDNIAPKATVSWIAGSPKTLWSVELGEGYAGAAVHAGRVYVLDYDQAAKADSLRCFALADGAEIWRRSYPVVVKRNHGMSRTTPAVTDRFVVSLGPKCHVLCADATTGETRWLKDLVSEFDTVVPEWYAGQCPLIDGDRVVLAPGGKALMIAVELATGKVVWQTPNPNGWQMTHSSIVPMNVGGEKTYVYCASGGVVGVSAKDGRLLWQTPEWTINTATIPSPVPTADGRVFVTGGYGSGSMMLKVAKEGSSFEVRSEFRLDPGVFGSEQQTPILYKDHLYGVSGGRMTCLDLGGKRLWDSGSTRFGLGPYVVADNKLLALEENGTLTIAEAELAGFKPLGQARILNGQQAWAPLAIAGSRLIARDLTRMVCVDLGGS